MKRIHQAIIMISLIPLVSVLVLYLLCKNMQPQSIEISSSDAAFVTSYLSENSFYTLDCEYSAFPGEIVDPDKLDLSLSTTTVTSLKDVKDDSFKVGKDFVGTLAFRIKLPNYAQYTIRFPAQFCEYKVYVNGIKVASSYTFGDGTPIYPQEFYIMLPASATGEYTVVINFITPTNYVNTSTSNVLIGTSTRIKEAFDKVDLIGLIMLSFVIFTICFTAIHIFTIRSDKRTTSFTLMSVMILLVTSISDGRAILKVIPHLPYQLGCFIEAFAAPLFLLSLLYLTYTMYPEYFSTKIGNIFAGLLIIPAVNALCLGQFAVLNILTTAVTVVPYAMCLYVFAMAYEQKKNHCLFYGAGILSMEISVLLDYATKSMAIAAHYSYCTGYVIMAVMMVAIIASEYSAQIHKEEYVTQELSKKLVDMQASENAFLNAQMKPHFLYNTLNTIADCCVTDSKKAQKLINSLSEYLKLILNLDNMDKTVPLRRELELVTAYTEIEKERFPSINFYNDFPVRMPSIMMPPITIQPLIENAIKHGVRKSDKPGAVTLRIVEHPDSVEFFVSDNGVGMTEDTINNLFRVPKENQSIGIYNIDKRLKNIYNRGLKVESTPGLGTCVSFVILKDPK